MDKKFGKLVRIIVVSLVGTMLLTSCFPAGNGKSIPSGKEGELAEAQFRTIKKAIEEKDKDILRSLFSKTVIKEAKDLDENIEYLFTLIPSEIKSWERQGTSSQERNEYGDKKESIQAFFDIETEQGKYRLHFIDCKRDDFDDNGVGLYFLSIIKAEDDQKYWGGWNSENTPGVFKPEEE